MAEEKKDAPAAATAPADPKSGEAAAKAASPADKPKGKSKPKSSKPDAEGEHPRKRSRGRSMRGLSRRHVANLAKVDPKKQYPLDDAIKLLKSVTAGTKFNQTVNIVMNLGIDSRHAEQMIRGAVSLPRGIGKTKRVIAFCDGEDGERARAAGASEVGIDDLIDRITKGWTEFDVAIAHPRAMGKVGKLGRVLGPQGKMPSPKNGTVTADIAQAVREFAAGKIEFRNDAGGNVHAIVGKANFTDDDLKENIQAFIGHIRRMKPATSKGVYIKKVCVSGTMSPAIELEVAQQ